ncbi:MAG: bifunctional adenosylcobinamide kinase/adenosylcobinamide-phosphate guanylyltransferase [Nitrospinota bacterium]|nr:bifunctional adenosylcobinamide kinase/adenosylcobinamide-phosphate guanylyltransferase [Nitrospinota bacterium]
MGRIVYITGGRRSGKSAFAQSMAERATGGKVYVATCPVIDQETSARVEAHKIAREGKGWTTIEEEHDLAGAINRAGVADAVLVECLTLWVNNLLHQAQLAGVDANREAVMKAMAKALDAAAGTEGMVIFVSNEVGLGIIPDNPLARNFSDMAGIINQLAAARADEAYLVVSGIAQKLK